MPKPPRPPVDLAVALTASIVVNTYDRARNLERLLPSLDQLDGVRFEVVVVNGPSTDDTDAVLAQYGGRIKIAHCPTANLSRSRNIGVAAAAGDVVVFIDDDALPGDAEWLCRLVETFAGDTALRIGAAGGASIHRDTDWAEFAGGWTSDYAEQIFTAHGLPAGADPARWFRRTVGNNSAFRRSALVAIGGFDERFRYYLDEADVCLRLARAGFAVVYRPDCPVRHYPARSPLGEPFIRDRRLIARSDSYYSLKNGADSLLWRLIETLRRAPRKHFVRELRGLVTEGRISRAELWRLRGHWLRGLVEGIGLGLFASRATPLTTAAAPPFVPFARLERRERLSICLVSRGLPPNPHAGGVGRYTYDLARGLHDLGHRVTVITESAVPIRHEGLGFAIIGIQSAAAPNGLQQTPILAQNLVHATAVLTGIEALASGHGPFDVVHASNWGIEALGMAQRDALPLVLMLVTPLECVMAAEGWELSLDLAANIELDQWVFERATRVCAPSSGLLASYMGRSRWAGRTVHTVPLGIVCQPSRPRRRGRRRRLLFVGRLERRKGIHVLLDILPRLLARHPDWQCDLVGNMSIPSGPGATFESQFRAQHAGAAWRDRVIFHGTVADEELQTFYARADLFVAPSLYESFGLMYLEAMQFGVPVVACDVGGVPEVVLHGEDGLLVPPGDPAALERALERLMSDAPLRTRFGAHAAQATRSHGSHLAMAGRMIVEYRAAIASHAFEHGTIGQLDASPLDGSRTDGVAPTVVEAAIAVLEDASPTRGLGLAFRASAAFEQGAHVQAASLVAAALGVSAHPDYYLMAVELALTDGDTTRAIEYALRGFGSAGGDQAIALAFAGALDTAGPDRGADTAIAPTGHPTPDRATSTRLFAAALAAIRSNRDLTAIVLLEACRAWAPRDKVLMAQLEYHLGSALKRRQRWAEARSCFARAIAAGAPPILPPPLRAALHFHLGELDLRDHDYGAGIRHLEACLIQNPAHGRAQVLLAEALAASSAAA